MTTTPAVEVRVSPTRDALLLNPRVPGQARAVLRRLRNARESVNVRRNTAGLEVSAADADVLLALEGQLDLRWRSGALRFAQNRARAGSDHADVLTAVRTVLADGPEAARALLADVPDAHVLDDHQAVNVAAMTVPRGFGLCVFDEQGTGKTVTAIYAFDVLVGRNEADAALVLAPKSMVGEWAADFERFKRGLYDVQMLVGDRRARREVLASRPDVLIANYEAAVSLERELGAFLRSHGDRAVLIADESFYAKNPDAARTRAAKRLREECGRAFVLCGTPAPNAPQDLVEQVGLVDFGYAFRGVRIPDRREDAAPIVSATLRDRGLYVRNVKAEVLPDLPSQNFRRVRIPFEPQQAEIYRRALNDYVLELRSTDGPGFARRLTSFFAQRSALLQICASPAAVVPTYAETPSKQLAIDRLVEEYVVGRGEKIVLWSFYTASLAALAIRYASHRAVRYDGSVSDVAERREAVRRFQHDDETMIFVANPAAAGAGLTLHRARVAIYESLSPQAAHYLQSLDRIHRRGQDRDVEYVVLLCEGSIEVTEFDRLHRKDISARRLLGDPVEPPATRDYYLREAEALQCLFEDAS